MNDIKGADWQWQAHAVSQNDLMLATLEANGWRPMSSAPRDGTEIIGKELGFPHREMTCYYHRVGPDYVDTWPSKEGGIMLPFYPDLWKPKQSQPV